MKVRVTLTVDVDPYSWGEWYGVATADVREVVHLFVRDNIETALAKQTAHGISGHIAEITAPPRSRHAENQYWASRLD